TSLARRITIIAKRIITTMSLVKKTTITTNLARKTATMSRAKNAMIRLIKRKMIHGFTSESMFCHALLRG
ncbi:hypothetical protein, partial [Bacillus paralicheniformis]|uniref:hypothetical protein n=1 Tax=Bacillus paralicheniformis TaxID=1648923 RepID=UPI00195DBFF2